jgi:hypothetical protein
MTATATTLRNVVPESMRRDVLRLIGTDLRYRGLSARELDQWGQLTWPHIEPLEQVQAIAHYLDGRFGQPGELSRPHQLVWTLPQEAPEDYPLEPHTDVPPAGREFALIVGVAFSQWTWENGTLRVWERGLDSLPHTVLLDPGDVVVLDPTLPHSPGVNRSGEIRTGMYVRWTKP